MVLYGIAKGNSMIENCSNNGTVKGNWRVGGIAGVINDQTKVNSCFNTGSIIAFHNNGSTLMSTVGGITGGTNGGINVMIQNCYNRGTVTGAGNGVGGILGVHAASIAQVMNIQYCYNTGEMKSDSNQQVGSIIGYSYHTNLTKCYTSTDLNARGASNAGTNTDCKKSLGTSLREYASILGAGYKTDTNSINNGFPILVWQ